MASMLEPGSPEASTGSRVTRTEVPAPSGWSIRSKAVTAILPEQWLSYVGKSFRNLAILSGSDSGNFEFTGALKF